MILWSLVSVDEFSDTFRAGINAALLTDRQVHPFRAGRLTRMQGMTVGLLNNSGDPGMVLEPLV